MENKNIDINKEITKKEDQDIRFIQENNNIVVDLLLKNSKITTLLNLLLDYINININQSQSQQVIISSKEYQELQDRIIHNVNLLHSIYTKLLGVEDDKK